MYSPYFPGSFGGQMYMPPPQQMFVQSMQPQFQGFGQQYNPGYSQPQMYFNQPAFQQVSRPFNQMQQPVGSYGQAQRPMLMMQSPTKAPAMQTVQIQQPTLPGPPAPPVDEGYTSIPAPQPAQSQTIRVAKISTLPQGDNEGGTMQKTIQVNKAPAARLVSRSNPQILADILAGKGASIQKPKARIAPSVDAVKAAPPPPPPQLPQTPESEPIIAKATPQDPPLTSVDENGNPKPPKPYYSPILKAGSDDSMNIPPVEDTTKPRVSFQGENNERVSRGLCGGCGNPVYNDEKRMKSEDGTYFHSECYNRLVAANANASSPQSM